MQWNARCKCKGGHQTRGSHCTSMVHEDDRGQFVSVCVCVCIGWGGSRGASVLFCFQQGNHAVEGTVPQPASTRP